MIQMYEETITLIIWHGRERKPVSEQIITDNSVDLCNNTEVLANNIACGGCTTILIRDFPLVPGTPEDQELLWTITYLSLLTAQKHSHS